MKMTYYFQFVVLKKRPYIKLEWCEKALTDYAKMEIQDNDRVRYWVYIPELGKYLRVVTLADGETLHNAFPDRDFEEPGL